MNWFNWCCVLFHQYFWQFSHSGISYNTNTNTHIQISNEEHKSVGLVNQLEGLVGRDYKSFAGASEDRLLLAFGSIWTPCNLSSSLLTPLVANSPDAPVTELAVVRSFLCLFGLFLLCLVFSCLMFLFLLFLCRRRFVVFALSRKEFLLWASSVASLRNKLQNFLPHSADLTIGPWDLFWLLECAGDFVVLFLFFVAVPSQCSCWSTAIAAGFLLDCIMASYKLCQMVTAGPLPFLVFAN